MKILFVVTARGGSKGVPRKNIAIVGNLPLIAYKIIAAQKCKYDKRIIVSTDDEEIADVAEKYGGEVPFMRPQELATDEASSMDVVEHAVQWIEKNDGGKYDYVCLLEPSSPFVNSADLDEAFDMLEKKEADTLLGMKEVDVSRNFIFPLDINGGLSFFYESVNKMKSVRRQDQPKEYTPNGCLYVAKWAYFKKYKSFHSVNSIPFIMPAERSVEIDSPLDLLLAKTIVANGMVDLSKWK